MRVDKPIGTLLLLWPTLWALWIAGNGTPSPYIVLVFIIGTFVMRAAGCVINDVWDRNFDRHVERTKDRPVTTGKISVKAALVLCAALCLVALLLVLTLNRLTLLLAGIGAFLAMSYPLFKRFSHLPQAYLGIAFGWGIPMAFAAHLEVVPLIGWLLLVCNIFWACAYDTFYALVDLDDDLRIGVKSLAVLAGRHVRLLILVCQGATLLILLIVGIMAQLNLYFNLSLLAGAGIFAWHLFSCREDDREAFFNAFLGNSWFGATVFFGILLGYM